MEDAVDKLIKDSKTYVEQANTFAAAGQGFATYYANIYHPHNGEYNLGGRYPDSADTIRNVDAFLATQEEIRNAVGPELELIDGKIIAPAKDLQSVMKLIRKSIAKREHKLVDYDRFNNSLMKLRDKKEKSLSDEKNLFKLEQDFEIATNEYDYINNALKNEIPQFMVLATRFIDPLFHSFFYMQLNISYTMMEKLSTFAEGKYDITNVPGAQISADYEGKRTDAWEKMEGLNITKRIISTSKMVQAQRSASGTTLAPSSLGRSTTNASTSSFGSRTVPPSSPGTSFKKAPPPPPSFGSKPPPAAPPPYSPGSSSLAASAAASAAAGKRPPPPPPMKSKPKADQAKQYVVALYDFAAQAEGDLSFNVGDRIEIIERTASAEDWWKGTVHGQVGSFPGNYVQEE